MFPTSFLSHVSICWRANILVAALAQFNPSLTWCVLLTCDKTLSLLSLLCLQFTVVVEEEAEVADKRSVVTSGESYKLGCGLGQH